MSARGREAMGKAAHSLSRARAENRPETKLLHLMVAFGYLQAAGEEERPDSPLRRQAADSGWRILDEVSAMCRIQNPTDLRELVQAAENELRQAQAAARKDPKDAIQGSVLAAYYAGAAIAIARRERSAAMLDRAHSVFFQASMLAQSACGITPVEPRYAPNQGDMPGGDIGFQLRDELMAQAEDCGESGDIECMEEVVARARKELREDHDLRADVETVVEAYFPELVDREENRDKRRHVVARGKRRAGKYTEYCVQWSTKVDHPEKRGPTLPRVPPGTALHDRACFDTAKRALTHYEYVLSGEWDSGSEYVQQAWIDRIDDGHQTVYRKGVSRRRVPGGSIEVVREKSKSSRSENPLGTLEQLPKGKRMWEAVYRSAKDKGFAEDRAAQQAWGAVKAAGYSQDAQGTWQAPRANNEAGPSFSAAARSRSANRNPALPGELTGPLQMKSRADGLWVVGRGLAVPVESRREGKKLIAEISRRPNPSDVTCVQFQSRDDLAEALSVMDVAMRPTRHTRPLMFAVDWDNRSILLDAHPDDASVSTALHAIDHARIGFDANVLPIQANPADGSRGRAAGYAFLGNIVGSILGFGLGALVGALAGLLLGGAHAPGAAVGGVVGGFLGGYVGSIAGAGYGAAEGAPKGRERDAKIGGAIGAAIPWVSLFTAPLGAYLATE